MLQQDEPDDYVVATGETHTVARVRRGGLRRGRHRRLANVRHARTRGSSARPRSTCSIGDAAKARSKLGWAPEVDFRGLVNRMVAHDLELETKKAERR